MRHHSLLPVIVLSFSAAAASLVLGCAGDTEDVSEGADVALSREQSSAGFSLGLHEGVRESSPSKVRIDTQKMTYSGRGKLTLHAYFEPKSDDEGADVAQADLFQMNFDLSFDEYARLFESSADVTIAKRDGDVYGESAQASGPQGNRKVILRWDNAERENTRKGEMEIALGPQGHIATAHMTKSARRPILGWKKVFDETVKEPTHREQGLLLLDDARVGRVSKAAQVQSAIDDPTPENFQRLVGR